MRKPSKIGKRRRHKACGTALSEPLQPNDLWCADYKGEFLLANHHYCYPFTITDAASRYLLSCEALSNTQAIYAFGVFDHETGRVESAHNPFAAKVLPMSPE